MKISNSLDITVFQSQIYDMLSKVISKNTSVHVCVYNVHCRGMRKIPLKTYSYPLKLLTRAFYLLHGGNEDI